MSNPPGMDLKAAKFYKATVGFHKFFVDKRYQNLKAIGDGSYGLVASADDLVTGRKVAIKKLKDTFIGFYLYFYLFSMRLSQSISINS